MKKLLLVLVIVMVLTIRVNAVEVKFGSSTVYLTSPEFSLPVYITPVDNLYGAAFDVLYDTNLLEIQGANIKIDSTLLRIGLEDGRPGRAVLGIARDDTAGINNIQEDVFLELGFSAKNVGVTELDLS